MFNINLYFVDTKDSASRFFIELIHDNVGNEVLSSTFYYEIIADFITNDNGEKELTITSVKEIYDIINYIYAHYGENTTYQYLMSGSNKDRILNSLDKLATKYASGEIDNNKIEFSDELKKFIKVYKEPDTKTNDNIYKENNHFIREYLSLKNQQKDKFTYDK